MHGFYLIDKPSGITSFGVLKELRKKLQTRKIGHSGTLDPLATGLLLVAVGSYTRLIPYFEKDRKKYLFTIGLDGESDSYDSDSEVRYISEDKKEEFSEKLSLESLTSLLEENFLGKIEQIPPKYSALKIGGKKAVDLVREGKEVIMKKRPVEVFSIQVLDFNYPNLTVEAEVSAGTYIRSIAADLGEMIGSGGYIKSLRRTGIGKLDLAPSQTLDGFDGENKLSEGVLFGEDKMISFDENMIRRLDSGLTTRGNFDLEIGKDYFVKNTKGISNVVRFDGTELIPVKKLAI